MIYELPPEKTDNIYSLFKDWNDTLIWSYLQGCMGRAWVDDIDKPKIAKIIIGDFCFLGGDTSSLICQEIILHRPDSHTNPYLLMISQTKGFEPIIEHIYKDSSFKTLRYATKKQPGVFDRAKLKGYIDAVKDGYDIAPIDEELYRTTQKELWSQDFCSQFKTFDDFSKHGLGFVVLHDGTPICGASSYTYYNNGIEIEISTVPEFRRKGLATACASRLIIECLDRNLYPSWDAANPESLALAEKLGYSFCHKYTTYIIRYDLISK